MINRHILKPVVAAMILSLLVFTACSSSDNTVSVDDAVTQDTEEKDNEVDITEQNSDKEFAADSGNNDSDSNENGDENTGSGNIQQDKNSEVIADNVEETAVHEYKIVIDDVTWEDAFISASQLGGHLVRIGSEEEYEAVIDCIKKSGYENKIFWIGARREDNPAIYRWVDENDKPIGENLNGSDYWLEHEPSFYDVDTGTFEKYVEMFYLKSADKWVFNDVQNDLLELLPTYSGKIGYIVEIE